jgi:hypothetical protein
VGEGVLNCVVGHILLKFYTLFLTRFRTYKIASPPQTKMTSKDDITRDWCLQISFVHGAQHCIHGAAGAEDKLLNNLTCYIKVANLLLNLAPTCNSCHKVYCKLSPAVQSVSRSVHNFQKLSKASFKIYL